MMLELEELDILKSCTRPDVHKILSTTCTEFAAIQPGNDHL